METVRLAEEERLGAAEDAIREAPGNQLQVGCNRFYAEHCYWMLRTQHACTTVSTVFTLLSLLLCVPYLFSTLFKSINVSQSGLVQY